VLTHSGTADARCPCLGYQTISRHAYLDRTFKATQTVQGLSTGIIYLYRRNTSGGFTLSQRLAANASDVTGFGAAFALATDGSVLLAGQPDEPADPSMQSYPTLIFTNVGNLTMAPGGSLAVPGGVPSGARFGQAVAVAGDGSQALISASAGPSDGGTVADGSGGGAIFGFRLSSANNGSVGASQQLSGFRSPDARWCGALAHPAAPCRRMCTDA